MSASANDTSLADPRRWWILGVLCFGLLAIVIDNSILNVAIPTLVRELNATNTDLQWIVDSYTLVFAGLLLTAGSLGDRYGRRLALQFGFMIFGIGSILAALSGTANELIGTRAFMGIGGAFIMPATLSIIANVFPANERGKAIGIWAATAGAAVALGPLVGGFLLEHFYWGSIFLVNIPVVVIGLLAGFFLIPNSKDPASPKLDPVGAVLSIVGLSGLLYAIIEGPTKGWTESTTVSSFVISVIFLTAFFIWEVRSSHPMLSLAFFRNPRFSIACLAITVTFFSMFGSIFVLTQYFQFVLGYSPLQTGIRLLAFAIPMMILAPMSDRFVRLLGTKMVVVVGLTLVALGLALSTALGESSSYFDIAWRMVIMASGMALTMAPATTSIMGALPLAKSGVGSAVNDTTRQIGGALGVAIVGSVFNSIYGNQVADAISGKGIPAKLAAPAEESLGFALEIAKKIGGAAGDSLAAVARMAFVDGFHAGLWVGSSVALMGAIAALIWLPARPRQEDEKLQEAEYYRDRSDALIAAEKN